MGICATCGNDYDKTFEVRMNGSSYSFDSFECAAHLLAPRCAACACTILEHGVEVAGTMFCCKHCAEHSGISDLCDRSAQACDSFTRA